MLLEDLAALLGLVFALLGVGLTLLTDNGYWDAVATGAIGLLLAAVAIVLAVEMKSLLLGESATPAVEDQIRRALDSTPRLGRVSSMRTLHLGPEELLVAVKTEVLEQATAEELATAINAAELAIRDAEPSARVIYIQPNSRGSDAASPRSPSPT